MIYFTDKENQYGKDYSAYYNMNAPTCTFSPCGRL